MTLTEKWPYHLLLIFDDARNRCNEIMINVKNSQRKRFTIIDESRRILCSFETD